MTTISISIVIITRNRMAELERCLHSVVAQSLSPAEIIVVDNASADGTAGMLAATFPQVRILTLQDNLGIPAARNYGYTQAKGDVCVTLDDDAWFADADALTHVTRYFSTMPDLCCVSFEVRNPEGHIIRNYIPRRDRATVPMDTLGASFVGTGHAFHRARFLELGGFWEQLTPYFGEEPDLAYRIIEAGYTILHTKHIAVIHAESLIERPAGRRLYCGTRNTPWIALRSLPWHAVVSLTVLAWGYYFLKALRYGLLRSYLSGVRDCLAGIPHVYRQRRRVSASTIAYLKRYSGVYRY